MSTRWITSAFDVRGITPAQKLLLVKLADNANDDGYCFPSRTYIALHTGLSKSAISRNLQKLQELGLIKILPQFQNGVQLPNHYQLTITGVVAQEVGGAHRKTGVGAQEVGGGRTEAHRTVIEPSLNQEKNTTCSKRKTAMPQDAPSERDIQLAKQYWAERNVVADVELEADAFRAHHAKLGSKFVDWGAAWRTWYVNTVKFRKQNGSENRRGLTDSEIARRSMQAALADIDGWITVDPNGQAGSRAIGPGPRRFTDGDEAVRQEGG